MLYGWASMGMSGANDDDRRKPRGQHAAKDAAGRNQRAPGHPFISVTIPSDFAASREIQKRIVESAVKAGYDSQCAFAIKLALEEAMINAIKHGNHLDPAKDIRVRYRVTPRETEITIEDQGPGFDRQCIPDPTADENIEKCSGRGILLIEAYMNDVSYECGGRRVRMIKKNASATPPAHGA